MTLKHLSQLTGLSTSYISEIENGVKRPSLDTLEILLSSLNVDLFKLLEIVK